MTVIQRWVRETKDDGSVYEYAENILFHNAFEARPAYERLKAQAGDPQHAKPGTEWGVCCPELDEEQELAPLEVRSQWVKEIRRVRLGQR